MEYSFLYSSPIGKIKLCANENLLISTEFIEQDICLENCYEHNNDIIKITINQLDEYFNGTRTTFDIPCKLEGTPFQTSVWLALKEIPFGETVSYKQLAKMVGNEKAMRAVGSANKRNPIGIIIPCHRVIKNDGTIGGYAGGIFRKEWLLEHEKKIVNISGRTIESLLFPMKII